MERFLKLLGKDTEGRPILSVYCSHFPDPDITDYDELLEYQLIIAIATFITSIFL